MGEAAGDEAMGVENDELLRMLADEGESVPQVPVVVFSSESK